MEAAALKKILELQEENLNMRRAIIEATTMLSQRCKLIIVPKYEESCILLLLKEVDRVVAELNNKAKPETAEESDPI